MLPKNQRLNRVAFAKFFQSGQRRHTPHLTIITAPSTGFSCAVVIGKKVAKKAHDRNRIRRRIYELIRQLKAEKGLIGVVIVVAKPTIAKLSKKQFQLELTKEIALMSINQ